MTRPDTGSRTEADAAAYEAATHGYDPAYGYEPEGPRTPHTCNGPCWVCQAVRQAADEAERLRKGRAA